MIEINIKEFYLESMTLGKSVKNQLSGKNLRVGAAGADEVESVALSTWATFISATSIGIAIATAFFCIKTGLNNKGGGVVVAGSGPGNQSKFLN